MNSFKKQLSAAAIVSAITFLLAGSASAHVAVKPGDVLTGSFQTFTVGVPNEKDSSVTSLKLQIPEGLQFVTPTVKTGWAITVEKEGEGETAKTKSITWSGGTIPAERRDDFTFSAKTPDKAGDLQWKAFETHEDGTTNSWDQDPNKTKGDDDSAPAGPYSITKVASKPASTAPSINSNGSNTDAANRSLAIAGLAIALLALAIATRKPAPRKK